MLLSLKNKTAIVCGSSQGIGKAIALQFAKMGATLILVSRNKEKLEAVHDELDISYNQKHLFIPSDFNYPEEAIDIVNSKIKEKSPIHILVNNSGGPEPGEANKADSDEYETAFRSHVIMSQKLVQTVIPRMKEEGFGRIINIISIGVKQPIDNLGVSNTIRGAMASWAKSLSKELGSYGITVNNILPGHTSTERLLSLFRNRAVAQGITSEEISKHIKSQIPAGRFAKPEEIAFAAGFLASEQASFINGINLPIDGGFLGCL